MLSISLVAGAALGVIGGLIYAIAGDRLLAHGIGAGLFAVGLVALALGLLGATEPPDGWRTGSSHRRSLAAKLALESDRVDDVSSLDLLLWAAVVGGGLLAASMLAFYMAAH